jgi:hypothetical protein
MRRIHVRALAAAGVAAVLAACASTPQAKTGAAAVPSPEGKDECLFFRTLTDWTPVDRERLIIYSMGRVPYLATLSFPNSSLTFDFAVGFHDHDNDGRLCGHGFDAVLFREGIPDRITIASLQRLDREEAKRFLADVKDARKRKVRKVAPPGEEPSGKGNAG